MSPTKETHGQRRLVQLIAVVALAASIGYLAWRSLFTLGVWWISVPLLLLELHAAIGLALFTFSLWELRVTPTPEAGPASGSELRVAVLITTYNEPKEVLLPTVAGAVTLRGAHRTLVLDDGDRAWVRDLCQRVGAQHVTRSEHKHAKAGNLNNAIEYLRDSIDVVAVLDADHVPTEDFLVNTVCYFADPDVALVQTPQDFYNAGSFEHAANRSLFWSSRRGARYNEQALFYRGIQSGKNRWNASFWCGTNALLRVSALRSVGGVAVDSLTEDIHTTIRMHRLGWKTVYHNESLAYGLAARSADEYQLQRFRWGTGAMQLLKSERPLTAPGLTLAQRLSYAATLLGWFDAWRTFGYVLLPMVTLLTGNRRRGERFALNTPCYLDNQNVEVVDISLTGTSLLARDDQPVNAASLELTLNSETITIPVLERSRRPVSPPGTVRIGIEFDKPTRAQLASLSRSIFQRADDCQRPAPVALDVPLSPSRVTAPVASDKQVGAHVSQ